MLFLLSFIIIASKWAIKNFGEISVEEILFQLFSPIVTTASDTITKFIKEVVVTAVIDALIMFFVIKVIFKIIRDKDLLIGFTLKKSVAGKRSSYNKTGQSLITTEIGASLQYSL